MKLIIRVLLSGLLIFSSVNSVATEPDWHHYAEVLTAVHPGSKHNVKLALVDYPALKASGSVEAVYRQLSEFPVNTLTGPAEKLAFYINAYNILALKMVIDHWPLDSIKAVGNIIRPVWGKVAGRIDGNTVTLDEIENKLLRLMGEPRIHFAIVCASVSCPNLRNEPYTAARLNAQLDDQVMQFLSNADKGLRIEQHRILVSKIFDWFEDDFKLAGGVEAFIRHYRPDLPALPIDADIDYDWSLNGSSPK